MRERLSINLSVARSCFVRCAGCYNHFGRPNADASTADIVRFLAFMRSEGFGRVTLCGGDPLARPDLVDLLRQIASLGLHIALDTVGTPLLGSTQTRFYGRIDVEAVGPAVLASLVDLIGIAIDGSSNASVSAFRAGRPQLLDEQLAILELLDRAGARVCVNTVVHRQNHDDVPAIMGLLQPFGSIDQWQLFQFSPTGPLGYRNQHRFVLSDASFERLGSILDRQANVSGFLARIELKPFRDRVGNYLLVDSAGLAWIPGPLADGSGERVGTDTRVIVGDITIPETYEAILRATNQTFSPSAHLNTN